MNIRTKLTLAAVVVGSALATTAFFGNGQTQIKPNNSLWTELTSQEQNVDRINLPSFAPLVKRVAPAVLVVTTESVVKQSKQQLPPEIERSPLRDFYRFFGPQGGGQGMPEQKTKGQGSGFIIHPSGYALTNAHVVDGATTISVKVGKELKTYEAEVIGADTNTDVALIKLKSDRKDWPVIPLGSSNTLEVGDFAVAIGNPLGLELSVSMGIVSARGRRDIHPSGHTGLYDFIQIDNPINPGNSGGPLLNLMGEAVGINTAISAQGQGIAFAIPIDQVKQILPQLKATGQVSRSWLGVQIQEVTPELAKISGLTSPHGALIREVLHDSPAKKAGIEAGDIVTEFEGKTVESSGSLQVMAGLAGVGKTVQLTLYRDGKPRKVSLLLEEMPKEGKVASTTPKQNGSNTAIDALGMEVANAANGIEGALITKVDQQSIAAYSGIEPNDVIIKLNNSMIKNAAALVKLVKDAPKDSILRIYLKRGKSTFFVAFNKP